jgi:hypothetical protein
MVSISFDQFNTYFVEWPHGRDGDGFADCQSEEFQTGREAIDAAAMEGRKNWPKQ